MYSEVVCKEGSLYSYMNPNGDEVTREHSQTVLICRAMPPIAGSWPQVIESDWCGQGKHS